MEACAWKLLTYHVDDGKEDEAQVSLAVRDTVRVQGGAQEESRDDGGHHGNLKLKAIVSSCG